jgi:hypothetical protein
MYTIIWVNGLIMDYLTTPYRPYGQFNVEGIWKDRVGRDLSIWSHDGLNIDVFWISVVFIELLQHVNTSKDYALTDLHTSQITIGHTRSSQSVTDFTNCCLVAAFNSGHSSSYGFPNCPRAWATSVSQQQHTTTEPQRSLNCPTSNILERTV